MKKTILLLTSLFFIFALFAPSDSFAQKTKKQIKKEIKAKAVKSARKEAKRLRKKEKWITFPGSLPLDKMLEKSYMKQYEEDEDGNPLYINADGNSVAGTKGAASLAAVEKAKIDLAGQVETRMAALITTNIANAQLTSVDAESVDEIQASAKNIIAMKLTNVDPVVKMYRKVKRDKVEVQVKLFYNMNEADRQAKQAIKKVMKDKLKDNEAELKKLMGM